MAIRRIAGPDRARARFGYALAFVVLFVSCTPAVLGFAVPQPAQGIIRRADHVEIALVNEYGSGPSPRDFVGPRRQYIRPPRAQDWTDGNVFWSMRSAWKPATAADVRTLRNLVLTRTNWSMVLKYCEFNPGIAIRWIDRGDTTTALACLDCSEMLGWSGKTDFRGEFDPSGAEWCEWARTAFPEDPKMQAFVTERIGVPRK
jgi:hypothetical protein